jgi:allantoate deiminase
MPIDPQRISNDIEAIAGFSEAPSAVGHSRPTFSTAWAAARDYVIDQATAAGCSARIDAAGNVFIRPESIRPTQKCWLSGSHIDSVPTGGKYDGVMGIVVPLEVLRCGAAPLELVIWAEEEGSTFGLGMIGSRLAVGDVSAASVAEFRNRAGQNFIQAGEGYGVRADQLAADRFDPQRYRGLIEVHAEQGPAMWAEGAPLAVVSAVAGRMQFKATLSGQANHAGSTPMAYRRDALVAGAKIITALEALAIELGGGTVATVGRIDCQPNAINVIPGEVRFTIDLRSGDPGRLVDGKRRIEQMMLRAALPAACVVTEDQPVVSLDAGLVQRLVDAGGGHRTISGALHDAAILAPHLPTAMLFVASKDGISHNPAEFSRIEDIAAAADVLAKVVSAS